MFIPLKIDMPDKFRIELPEKLTVVHLLDLDESKCERLIAASARSIAASARSIAISVGVVLTAIIIIGGVVRYVFTDAHRADAALAAAPAAPEAPEAAMAAAAAAAAEKPLRMAVSNILYMRQLFPPSYFNDIFNDKSVASQVIMLKDLMRKDAESGRMIDWMERGVNDALQNKYLKTLVFCVCEAVGGPMIEEYAFSFSYPNSEITPNQLRSSVCKIDVLTHLIAALDVMPEERTILMKLLYCDDFTDVNYEPPGFKSCTEVDNPWTKNPMKVMVTNVNSKHLVFDLEVKSVLYDSEVIQNVDVGLGGGCVEVWKGSFKGESSSQSKRSRKASVVKEPIIHCQKPFSFW